MGQLRQNFVLQSEAKNEIYAGFLVSFSNQKPRMKYEIYAGSFLVSIFVAGVISNVWLVASS